MPSEALIALTDVSAVSLDLPPLAPVLDSGAATVTLPALTVGVFGKLPSHGDFVRLGASDELVSRLDAWIAQGLTALDDDEATAELWRETWVEAPPWRFVLAPRSDDRAWTLGVIAASLDRPGRHFPLVLTCEIADGRLALALAPRLTERLEGLIYWAFENAASASDLLAQADAIASASHNAETDPLAVEALALTEIAGLPALRSAFWTLGGNGSPAARHNAAPTLYQRDFTALFGPRTRVT